LATKKTNLKEIGIDELDFAGDPPRLIWIRVKDAIGLLWIENPKLHDVGGVIVSLQKHGYQEFPKFDKTLTNVNGGKGAIKAGNGRIESLYRMEADEMEMPRGLAKLKGSGDWAVAIGVGVDAESEALAKSYAVDSNNLTMAGGDFTALDMARMWSPDKYMNVLNQLGEHPADLPVSVGPEVWEHLDRYLGADDSGNPIDDPGAELDRADELQDKWKVERGDVWGLGAFTVCPKCGKVHELG